MRARRLLSDEVGAAHAIVAACGRALTELGYRNWDPPIALDKMRADATNDEVWIVEEEGAAVATFTLAATPPKPWPREIFDPEAPALYVNRLAVVPSRWRGGLGRACMQEVEGLARARGLGVVRLDVFRGNAEVRRFYERLGYVARGDWDGGDVPLTCFEKELT
jgi:GNAT superfamily N-acetyltransferase